MSEQPEYDAYDRAEVARPERERLLRLPREEVEMVLRALTEESWCCNAKYEGLAYHSGDCEHGRAITLLQSRLGVKQ